MLVVQDLPSATDPLLQVLDAAPGFEVIGPVARGRNALEFAVRHQPNLVVIETSDFAKSTLDTIESIMADVPTPILLRTANAAVQSSRLAFDAIRSGALDFVVVTPDTAASESERARLLETIRFLSKTPVVRHVDGSRKSRGGDASHLREKTQVEIVAIVASTGGPNALAQLLPTFAPGLTAAVVIVQHLADGYAGSLVDWLGDVSPLPVRIATDGERLMLGTIYLAPDHRHLLVERGGKVSLSAGAPVDGHRPSGNLLLGSVARAYGPAAIGIVLTGMGNDGTSGLLELRQAGGRTIAQDEESSTIYGMPRAAWEAGAVEQLVPLRDIGTLVNRWVHRRVLFA